MVDASDEVEEDPGSDYMFLKVKFTPNLHSVFDKQLEYKKDTTT